MDLALKKIKSQGEVKMHPVHSPDKNETPTRIRAKNEEYKLLRLPTIARLDLIREGSTWKMMLELRLESRGEETR